MQDLCLYINTVFANVTKDTLCTVLAALHLLINLNLSTTPWIGKIRSILISQTRKLNSERFNNLPKVTWSQNLNWDPLAPARMDSSSIVEVWTSECVLSHLVVSNALWPYGPKPPRLLCLRDSPGNNTGVGCHALLHGIFLTWELNFMPLMSPTLVGSLPLVPPGKPWTSESAFKVDDCS